MRSGNGCALWASHRAAGWGRYSLPGGPLGNPGGECQGPRRCALAQMGAEFPTLRILPEDRHAENIRPWALRLRYHLADGSSYSPNHRVHQLRAKCSNRTSGQEIVIDRSDLFAEDHAVVAQPTGACGENHMRRAYQACGEDWGDYQVVPHSISDVFRNHHRGPRLMRVIWLARREHVPDLTTSGPRRWRPASLPQVADSRRLAADRRIARQAFRSGPITSPSARAY